MSRSSQRWFAATGIAVFGCLLIAGGCGRDEAVFGDAASPIQSMATPSPGPSPTPSGSADIVPGQPRWWAPTGTPVPGISAIEPSLPVVEGQPAITEQDVRDYIAANPPGPWDPASPPPTVKRIEFLPVQDIEVRLDHFIHLPTDTLLCLVTIQGKWLPPPGMDVPEGWKPDPNAVVYQIFNAQTGNLVARTSGVEPE
jgi:hypothetical protein